MDNSGEAQWMATGDACARLGISGNTLRSWAERELINYQRTPGGHRRYDVNSVQSRPSQTKGPKEPAVPVQRDDVKGAIYCRVSSNAQKDKLQRQIETLQSKYPTYKVFKDIGSGLNCKRKALKRLLVMVQSKDIQEVAVVHKDRLARFGVDLIEWIITSAGASLIVFDPENTHEWDEELTEDLFSVIQMFSNQCRGKRRFLPVDKNGEEEPKQKKTKELSSSDDSDSEDTNL